jgi:hypothetical protein
VKQFATDDAGCELDWNNHRRVRLRSALAAIEEWLLKLEAWPRRAAARGSALSRLKRGPRATELPLN